MRIIISEIPHKMQRYDTLGDWYYAPNGDLLIFVSNDVAECKDRIQREAVILHELTEMLLCSHAGIPQKQVDEFDFHYPNDGEPGEDKAAPYRRQHMVADIVERLYIHEASGYNRGTTTEEPML